MMMRIETLVATIDQTDYSLIEKMNIQTDSLVANQCDRNSTDEFQYNGHSVRYINTDERGVGKNRNLLLQHASADLCIFADDDMRFEDHYPSIAENAFRECPDADILIFNLIEKEPRRFVNKTICPVRWYNYAKYGAARIAFRRDSLERAGIRFHTSFGGGTRYGSGEDTIFLRDCLNKSLKIYAVPYALAEIDQNASSTWFGGFNDKFFFDKGALYAHLHPFFWRLFVCRYILRYRKKYSKVIPLAKAWSQMLLGGKEYSVERICRH